MPLPIPPDSPQILPSMATTYPITPRQASCLVDGVHTEVTTTSFSDKILITVTQNGSLAQWVCLFLPCMHRVSQAYYMIDTRTFGEYEHISD